MTVLDLQDGLQKRWAALVEGQQLEDTLGNRRPVSVFCQALPVRQGTDEDAMAQRPEPYILIQLTGGIRTDGYEETETVEVLVTVLVGDTGADRQGHRDTLWLLESLRLDLTEHPLVAGKYRYKGDVQWALGERMETAVAGAMLLTFDYRAPREVLPEPRWG